MCTHMGEKGQIEKDKRVHFSQWGNINQICFYKVKDFRVVIACGL